MQMIRSTLDFAASGWVVEVNLAGADASADPRFFAVGLATAEEATQAVLRYPGMMHEDERIAIRPLSREEIFSLGLRPQAVRPHRNAMRARLVAAARR